jgi:superfamily II DNA or RNA helicase
LASLFAPFVRKVIVLRGGMSARELGTALTALRSDEPGERLVLATGRYLGEGFDYAPLDTLFLTLPISWKGTLAQYVGRLHREHAVPFPTVQVTAKTAMLLVEETRKWVTQLK